MAHRRFAVAFAATLVIGTAALTADEQQPPTAYIDAGTVDADFAFQGEYAGTLLIDGQQCDFGAHVIALGEGKFDTVGYRGGLPGDGWDRSDIYRGSGETQNGELKLRSDQATATVKTDVMAVLDKDGNALGELKRTLRKSPTLGAKPPEGAIVLFDGMETNRFSKDNVSKDGLLKQGSTSDLKIQSGTLHLEFLLSYMPKATGQQRANSGCYLQGRYEVQILDSFGLKGDNHECGGIYEISDPSINMCLPPLSWQTYDIEFTAAKFDDAGNKTADARLTVKHNGVVIQKDIALPFATRAAPVKEGAEPGPIYLQDHGNPIRYRNIWFVEKK
jgi:hypothetical protein